MLAIVSYIKHVILKTEKCRLRIIFADWPISYTKVSLNGRATGGVSIKVRTYFQAVFTLAKVSPNKLHKNAKKYTPHTNSTNIILDAYK